MALLVGRTGYFDAGLKFQMHKYPLPSRRGIFSYGLFGIGSSICISSIEGRNNVA
jgi:hypothetical protein